MATEIATLSGMSLQGWFKLAPAYFNRGVVLELTGAVVRCDDCGEDLTGPKQAKCLAAWAFGPAELKCACGNRIHLIARDANGEQV